MRSDEEIASLLEDWLHEEAQPMPQPLLETVLEGVARRSQVRPRTGIGLSWLTGGLASVAVVAVVSVALIVAPSVVPQLRAIWRSATGAPAGQMHWDAMLQFREYPVQLNPAPDAYGHAIVFTYLRSAGAAHDPTQYVPLPRFEHLASGFQRWYDPDFPGVDVGWQVGTGMLTVHPGGGGIDAQAAIVAWRNPVAGSFRIQGSVEVDGTCGDGITFSIQHATDVFETFGLRNGSRSFELDVEPFQDGEVLHFIVEPGADSRCDATRFNVMIDMR